MQIVIVDTLLTTPPTGGAHTFLVNLCDLLVRRGTRISVVTEPGTDDSLVKAIVQSGAEIHMDLWRPVHLAEERGARLAAWVNERRPDVYVVSVSPDAGWLALPSLDPQIGTMSIAHNDIGAFYAPLMHYGAFIDCAVGVSEETRRKIVEHCSIPPERTREVPYGVQSISIEELETDIADSSDPSTPLAIGYVGRIVQEQKRIMDFVPLASELRLRDVSFELHFIGEGSERPRLATALEKQGLTGHAKFWGWLESGAVRRRLRELDVFLLMSDYEGLPVALLEAMGHGLVPVVSRIASGNGQLVIDGENGFLIDVGDIATFAQRLKLLADEGPLLARMKRAAWKTSRQYTMELMVDRYLECFDYIRTTGLSREQRIRAAGSYPIMASCTSNYPVWLRKVKRHLQVSHDALYSFVRAVSDARHD